MPQDLTLQIAHALQGAPLPPGRHASLCLTWSALGLRVQFEGPYAGDPAPSGTGSTWALWEHEVLELYLVGDAERYLELEWGPHGHYLALELNGVRRITRRHLPLDYEARLSDGRWSGDAFIRAEYIPMPVLRLNAFAVSGVGTARQYRAAFPLPGTKPDFHQISRFPLLSELGAST